MIWFRWYSAQLHKDIHFKIKIEKRNDMRTYIDNLTISGKHQFFLQNILKGQLQCIYSEENDMIKRREFFKDH